MSSEAQQFFNLLWPVGLPDGGHLVVVRKVPQGMSGEFFDDIAVAAARAEDVGQRVDVYVGMAAQPMLQSPSRGETSTALAIPGIWLDLDFEKGFGDEAGVEKFLAALPLPPTVLVSTGGGVHAYWLFREPLECGTEEQRKFALSLTLGWLRYCREVAKLKLRATLDAVADLARIMRVPGTRNYKRDTSRVVTLAVTAKEPRYNPGDFENYRVSARQSASTGSLDYVVRAGAQPPIDKWMIAIANDQDIQKVWEHRVPMPVDSSLSGYDLGLATRLDRVGFTPQEVVDTLVAHRAKWERSITDADTLKDPLHIKDPGYYERILRKARATNEQERASDEVIKLTEEVNEELSALPEGAPPPPELRAKFLHSLSEALGGVFVVDVWTVDRVEAPWCVKISCAGDLRDVEAVTPDRLLHWDFWKRLILTSGVPRILPIPAKMPAQLLALVSRLGSIVRVTGRSAVLDELVAYLWEVAQEAPPYAEASVTSRQAFRKLDGGPEGIKAWGQPEECLHVTLSGLRYAVRLGRCPETKHPGQALRKLGFVGRVVATRADKDSRKTTGSTTRHYFCIPLTRLAELRLLTGVSQADESNDGEQVADGNAISDPN